MGSEGYDHYLKGVELFENGNQWEAALVEFVKGLGLDQGLAESTDIIGQWHDCMQMALMHHNAWLPSLSGDDLHFGQNCEAAYTHMKKENYKEAAFYFEEALKVPPAEETNHCLALCKSGKALAIFGYLSKFGMGNPNAGDMLREAIKAQLQALMLYPEVDLSYCIRPYVSD